MDNMKHNMHEAHQMQAQHQAMKHDTHAGHEHMNHHAHMVADFRRRFWISLTITVPTLILSPMIQEFLGLGLDAMKGIANELEL